MGFRWRGIDCFALVPGAMERRLRDGRAPGKHLHRNVGADIPLEGRGLSRNGSVSGEPWHELGWWKRRLLGFLVCVAEKAR
jgi:hypothetical protein